jgi:hypothetical protein
LVLRSGEFWVFIMGSSPTDEQSRVVGVFVRFRAQQRN